LTPRRISARVASIGTPDTSRGTTSRQPSAIGVNASSIVLANFGMLKKPYYLNEDFAL
jgi:hypothetical protein